MNHADGRQDHRLLNMADGEAATGSRFIFTAKQMTLPSRGLEKQQAFYPATRPTLALLQNLKIY
jgi:hypothetical protein